MMTKKRLLLFLTITGLAGLILSSCSLVKSSSPSVIVLAVDHLGVNQLNCSSETSSQVRSGMSQLCQESVRFTHAYTTSPLSGPALASILTGQYPYEHGLRSNTKSFLPSRVTTLPEIAMQNGMATSFFSGGAPVLRKLNLQQGFETFDDAIVPAPTRFFRSFRKTQKIFESWLHEVGHQNFFSVFYVPDLIYIDTPTQNSIGENRNLSYESQLEEFDDALDSFIRTLKEKKIWDSTMVVLVGLNGPNQATRGDELSNLNLFSEKTQVGLLIKPAQKPRDQGIHWSFDDNVTLADVGATLAESLGFPIKSTDLPVLSLLQALTNPSPSLDMNRPILIESGWSGTDAIRYAIRWEQYLFLLDQKPQVYNSLIDKQETTPVPVSESGVQEQWDQIQQVLKSHHWKLWAGISRNEYLMWKGLSELWTPDRTAVPATSFERLAHRLRDEAEVTTLYSRELLNQQNWTELQRWSQGLQLKDLEFVALRNLKKDFKTAFQNPCLALVEMPHPQSADLKRCENPLALSLIEWIAAEKADSSDSVAKESSRKRFLRQYVLYRLDRKIAESNYAFQGIWDVSSAMREPSLTLEMMLSLPEMQKYRLAALKAFQQMKED